MKKRGLLLVDRGSREKEAKTELDYICKQVKDKGNYVYSNYCFLEVIPPYIEEGIKNALEYSIDSLTIVPYFLYPGKKVKAAVSAAMKLQSQTQVKFLVSKSMSMHQTMIELVKNRANDVLKKEKITVDKKDVDVLIIGHGSKDLNAKRSIQYVADGIRPIFRNVEYCFLEIEEPTIHQGIERCKEKNPKVLVIVFYFLHEGAHVKRDIYEDLNPALEKYQFEKVLITKHIGTDEKMIELILERAKEVEDAN
ncbi:MAG: sirohydrochlorin cobaltochelatase [Nitrosopumilaceae archaeon]|nr:sirohydrochlorin cobaltochelatase [Nitrosopumilaceae archaeon]NIU00263.1 sirohydrochlorin cobaltochelatase [Nitrosopumilaceae archaeon]NIU86675.1 sirohydrochlorin cobaltochelatase [Nitrosopumilaceae archaeon]NIV65370.1 sirohydrochlorin cobaltochelatase [Nitrosopumilaceae archaeon]NIX60865.1 sirohydrochlorin cobaltochelatase [Nitrosopumilaceae archaeon]